MTKLPVGIYERLLDDELKKLIEENGELFSSFETLEHQLEPQAFSAYLEKILVEALGITKHENRIGLVNSIIDMLGSYQGLEYLKSRKLIVSNSNLLRSVSFYDKGLHRPETPLTISSLLTGQGGDPALEHEIRTEMLSSDRVDILISFIKWSGLRLLMDAFEKLHDRSIPVRILSTSYMGASDPEALEWLAKFSNVDIRISYDTDGTRLHAKAYLFVRNSGFSTAYIGSANMSHSAMTQGLEWTMKVTAQDSVHILNRFSAEFGTYWESEIFEPFTEVDFQRFRTAINRVRNRETRGPMFFGDIVPRPFQLRILEALQADRDNGNNRNLVVAATGTGKTVISALDYKRYCETVSDRASLLYVAHRQEILEQARDCFRVVLKDSNFGELLVGGQKPLEWKYVFASVQSLNNLESWQFGEGQAFQFVIIDEVHHSSASSYRPIFNLLEPEILLGLTATPERMDGSTILPDFGNRFTAEIRLPEALEEKLLCPFHYFGVTDTIDLSGEHFWRGGKYNLTELENVFTGDDIRAKQRVDNILKALDRYQPDLSGVKGVGFCVSVKHAKFMANYFNQAGVKSEVLLGETDHPDRVERLALFRKGDITFLFTVDVLSEGIDVPEINLVMFLRPTESLTVFLQQLGRGLRHAVDKECLTVLDFVGQMHKKYRFDTKFSALLSRRRKRIDKEVENDFPHLPPGCSIQLEKVAKERVLEKIRAVLNNLNQFIPEALGTWEEEYNKPPIFGDFVKETDLSPLHILRNKTWSQWKVEANLVDNPEDPDLSQARKALTRLALRTDPVILRAIENIENLEDPVFEYGEKGANAIHYLLWNKKGSAIGVQSARESLAKWKNNKSVVRDAIEIVSWRKQESVVPIREILLPFECNLKLHASYGSGEIKAELGVASLESPGQTGTGVIHVPDLKAYIHLITFRKDDKDFAPALRYEDYPISRTLLHWQSQSKTTQEGRVGKDYINFLEREYTILFFARVDKKIYEETAPFVYLGPAKELKSYEGNRPISMVWDLEYPIPADMFEEVQVL